MTTNSSRSASGSKSSGKKPYEAPQLTRFGTVASLTQSNTFTACDDNATDDSGCGDMAKPNMWTN